MYSVNGIALDFPARGWALTASTKPLSEYTWSRPSLTQSGRDGVVAGLPVVAGPVTIPLAVETPKVQLEALFAAVGGGGALSLTAVSGREVVYETAATSYRSLAAKADEVVEVTFLLRLPGVFWRDKLSTTYSGALVAASTSLTVFPGLSAPIQDAVVRVKGAASGIQVSDASGAWVTLPAVTASQWVRFESGTGRAFVTSTDVWAGGAEVSGLVDFGGPRSAFEITPVLAPLDPSSRKGLLTVATGSRSGALVEVRGKGAYLL